jgi:hypothetical protein
MNNWQLSFAGFILSALPLAACAESLRCSNGIAAEGDSRLAVISKCGQPDLRDGYCAPVYYNGTVVPGALPYAYVPCIYTEEWVYERGPGAFMATVRIRDGRVQSISYGRHPQ